MCDYFPPHLYFPSPWSAPLQHWCALLLYLLLCYMFCHSLYLNTIAPVDLLQDSWVPYDYHYYSYYVTFFFLSVRFCPSGLCSTAIIKHQSGKKWYDILPLRSSLLYANLIFVLHSSLILSALSEPIYVGFSSLIQVRNHQRVSEYAYIHPKTYLHMCSIYRIIWVQKIMHVHLFYHSTIAVFGQNDGWCSNNLLFSFHFNCYVKHIVVSPFLQSAL